jgi:hypothetical protein
MWRNLVVRVSLVLVILGFAQCQGNIIPGDPLLSGDSNYSKVSLQCRALHRRQDAAHKNCTAMKAKGIIAKDYACQDEYGPQWTFVLLGLITFVGFFSTMLFFKIFNCEPNEDR